jgi:biopolymer transport protein ExbB
MNLVESLLQLTLLGSIWVLWLLVILSVVSVAVMIERSIYYFRARLDFAHFSQKITEKLLKDDIDGIIGMCEALPALEAQMALKGFEYVKKGPKAMEESMTGYIIGQRKYLDRWLIILGTLGNNAPFIGLFGTVLGIIQAFHSLASNPAGGPAVVMAGISEALVATAVGLLVAIPAVVAYNAFQRIVKQKLSNAENLKKIIAAHYS